ncbi:putative barnase/colicin E5 family endoribonuclease, partial [Helicobacter pylori]|uniref:putative barnase/colicin E5 family endoribonuclease n=1 Tax=Helicobacter pylori TaxID=210 RepID=UPI0036F2068D
YIKKGLKPKFAEQRALNLVRMMPEVIEKGKVGRDAQGRLKIEFKNQRVGLNDSWKGETLNNRWVITSYELNQSRNGLIKSPLAPNYKGKDTNPLNLDNPNPNTKN